MAVTTRTASGIKYDTAVKEVSQKSSPTPTPTKSTGSGDAKLAAYKASSSSSSMPTPVEYNKIAEQQKAKSPAGVPQLPGMAVSPMMKAVSVAKLPSPTGMGISPMMKTVSGNFVPYENYRTRSVAVESARRAEAYRAAAEKRIDKANVNNQTKSFLKGVVADTPANALAMFGSAAFGAELMLRNPRLADDAIAFGVISMAKAIKDTAKNDPARLAGQVVGAVATGKIAGKVTKGAKGAKTTKASSAGKVTKPLSKEQRLAANVAKKNSIKLKAKAKTLERKIAKAKESTVKTAKQKAGITRLEKELRTVKREIAKSAPITQARTLNRRAGYKVRDAKQAVRKSKPVTKVRVAKRNVGKATAATNKAVRRSQPARTVRKAGRTVSKAKQTVKTGAKKATVMAKRTIAQEFNSLKGKILAAFKGKRSGLTKTQLRKLQYELDYANNLYQAKRINALAFRRKIRKINADFEALERAEMARVYEPVNIKVSTSAPATKKGISAGVNKQGKNVRNIGQEFKKQQKPQGNAIASGSGDQMLLQAVKTEQVQKQVQIQATKIKQVQDVKQKVAVKQGQRQAAQIKINGQTRTIQKLSPVTALAVLFVRPMLSTATKQALIQTARPMLKPAYAQRYAQAQAQRPVQTTKQATKPAVKQAVKPAQKQAIRPAQRAATSTALKTKLPVLPKGSSRPGPKKGKGKKGTKKSAKQRNINTINTFSQIMRG